MAPIPFNAKSIDLEYLRSDEFREKGTSLRGSIMILGPLLARFGKAMYPHPEGIKSAGEGWTPILLAFSSLGASFSYDQASQLYSVDAPSLQGSYMLLDEASVTGTANILMCAVLAKGTTTIYNAACEPYIQQLSNMLIRMGAKIEGIGSNLLTIHGHRMPFMAVNMTCCRI